MLSKKLKKITFVGLLAFLLLPVLQQTILGVTPVKAKIYKILIDNKNNSDFEATIIAAPVYDLKKEGNQYTLNKMPDSIHLSLCKKASNGKKYCLFKETNIGFDIDPKTSGEKKFTDYEGFEPGAPLLAYDTDANGQRYQYTFTLTTKVQDDENYLITIGPITVKLSDTKK